MYLIDFKNKKIECTFRGHLINIYEWDDVKPILKPFDDALKIEEFTDLFSEYSLENLKISFYALGTRSMCWKSRIDLEQYEWLLENHYDVFGLIDVGLAVSI